MNEYNPKAVLRTTKIIYLGVMAMPILFLIGVFFLIKDDSEFIVSSDDPLLLSLIILSLLMIPVSIIIPKNQIKNLKQDSTLKSKLAAFQTVLIIRAAIWEGIANFGIVISLLTSNLLPICISIIAIFIIAVNHPGMSNIRKTISLNPDEIIMLEG